ncbi:MAG: PcfK-like family protein [Muribaculaceae bacterium]|nr:PcfK-like family protein [Muribaculaceae bacterium]
MKNNTDSAKQAVKAYLDNRAATDPLFAASYAKKGKSIDECFRYILGEARKRGNQVCMTDEEVYGLAVHYYDEDDIKVAPAPASYTATTGAKPAAKVPELTDEEKAEIREKARKRYEIQCLTEIAQSDAESKKAAPAKRPARKPDARTAQPYSPSLFD